jgi:hypothetical protein
MVQSIAQPRDLWLPSVQKQIVSCGGGGVVVVEVVLVEVEVVLVEVLVVVVVCAWQVPPEQLPLQHWAFLVQVLPLRLQPIGSAEASPMPSDPSVPPTTAAPINLSALPRVMEPSASPLARSSKKPSSLAIAATSSHSWIISPNQYWKALSAGKGRTDEQNLALFEQNLALFRKNLRESSTQGSANFSKLR